MKKTFYKYRSRPVCQFTRKLVEFSRLFTYECNVVQDVKVGFVSAENLHATQVFVDYEGGIKISLFVINGDDSRLELSPACQIQILTAWKEENTSFNGWQAYNH